MRTSDGTTAPQLWEQVVSNNDARRADKLGEELCFPSDMFYQADWLLTMDSPPLPGGWLRLEGDRISAVGAESELPTGVNPIRLRDCALLPGFINAHCHLELTALQGKLPARASFPDWVQALRAETAGYAPEDYRHAARRGIESLLRGGCTTVVDVGNTGESLLALADSPLRALALVEVLGLDPDSAQMRFEAAQTLAAAAKPSPRIRTGLAAHSAYACSMKLLNLVAKDQQNRDQPFTLHAAESREEQTLFATADGPLQHFCSTVYPQAPLHRNTTPLQLLATSGIAPRRMLVAHGNYATEDDNAWLAQRQAAVVHCPASHAFFGHAPFPLELFQRRGVPVCLGTDSLASGNSLSMLEQICDFRNTFPQITSEAALRAATVIPGSLLNQKPEVGSLRPGFKADFIAIRIEKADPENLYDAVLRESAEVALCVIGGEEAWRR